MTRPSTATLLAGLALATSTFAVTAQSVAPTTPPDPPAFSAQADPILVGASDILQFRALPDYHEPLWVTANFVDTGRLPPVKDRLPREPLVFKTANMPDGIGIYGDVMRHVTGGRPEGWNFMAGQSQGWGGIDIGLMECLTRTGPLFSVKAEELAPLPNLAKSWEWSADGHVLTMHLIEGAKWSDGVPFTTEDIMFYWEDHVLDPNVSPLFGTTQETFGPGTTLEAIDDFTIAWTFAAAFPEQYLYEMAYGNFCPGPAHIFKPLHPRYNPATTYDQYVNAIPAEYMNLPVMGAWVPVTYRPDDIIVLRRNPYYWKVDENGNQLPYLDEIHYRLSSWEDRNLQASAGTGDFANLEQPDTYVEALKRAADPAAPATLQFGPRTSAFGLYMNFSANGWGEPDERGQAVRRLNRNLDFRKAITTAIDRQRLGQALVKGPFTAIYPGGIQVGTTYYDRASTIYYPPSIEAARAYLEAAGLVDTDGDGWVNWPAGTLGGGAVEIVLLTVADDSTNATLADGLLAQLEAVGLRVVLNRVASNHMVDLLQSGQYDWVLWRNGPELVSVVQGAGQLAPTGPYLHLHHRAGSDGTMDLLPFEADLVSIVEAFIATSNASERIVLMQRYQRIYTENVYGIGLTQFPGALMINKRFANIPVGTPIFMFNYAEDSIMRERIYVPADKQGDYELHPNSLPGAPGSDGPIL